MSDVPQAPLPAPPATAPVPPRRRRFIGFLVVGVLVVAVLVGRDRYLRYNHTHIRTDDAYVEGTIYSVASRVPGTVARVNAAVNQRVRAGEVLVELDPDVARERLVEAEAALQAESLRGGELAALRAGAGTRIAAAEANLARVLASREELAAAVAVREADVRSRTVLLGQAQNDLTRAENLFAKKVIPRDRFEQAQTAAESARESLASARELKKQAEVALANHATAAAQARAAVAVEKTALEPGRGRHPHARGAGQGSGVPGRDRETDPRLRHPRLTRGRVCHQEGGGGRQPDPGRAAAAGRRLAERSLRRRELQGNPGPLHQARPARADQGRRDPRSGVHRAGRQPDGRHRCGLLPVPPRKRERQLRQGRAAHPGQDRPRPEPGGGGGPAGRHVRQPDDPCR